MCRKLLVLSLCVCFSIIANSQQLEKIALLPADTFAIYQNKQKAELQKGKDLKEESRCYDQIAYIYWEHNMFQEAADWYKRSYALNQQLDNLSGMSQINSNLGLIYADLHQYEQSYECFRQTLAYRNMMKDKVGIISSLINMSVVLNNLKRYDESIESLSDALKLAREMNDIDQMRSCAGMLYETYVLANRSEEGFKFFEQYRTLNDQAQREKKERVEEAELKVKLLDAQRKNQELQLQLAEKNLYEKEEQLSVSQTANDSLYAQYSKAELHRSLLEKDNALKTNELQIIEAEKSRQRTNIIFLTVLLIVVGGALVVSVRLFRQKQRANELLTAQNDLIVKQALEIEKQSNNLTDSINYARRIQNAALKRSHEVNIRNVIDDYFVFFRPSSIVSGDFYWFTIFADKLILVAADCTGHGVPGAFMSVIGMSRLHQIVEEDGIYMPDQILLLLHYAIIETLDQKHTKTSDGMDVAAVTVDFQAKQLYFAGAYRPMMLNSKGVSRLVKGNICSLGASQELFEKMGGHFTLHTIDLEPDMQLYLFSDGYQDQVNEQVKKIGSRRFYHLIDEICALPMPEQFTRLKNFFEVWQGDTEQVDDVMVMGFSLSNKFQDHV